MRSRLTRSFFGSNCGLWAPDYVVMTAEKCLEILLLLYNLRIFASD